MILELKKYFGKIFEPSLINEILQCGTLKDIPEGFTLLKIGSYVNYIPLVISGAIKIVREDKYGNQLLLHYIEKGETCSMTLIGSIQRSKSKIKAIAETDTKIIMIPIQKMEIWLSKFKSWRKFVFMTYYNRLNEMLLNFDSIAFEQLDKRLINYLKKKTRINNSKKVEPTHQEIAEELNSSRVVISRLLKKIENNGKIVLHRNSVEILNLD